MSTVNCMKVPILSRILRRRSGNFHRAAMLAHTIPPRPHRVENDTNVDDPLITNCPDCGAAMDAERCRTALAVYNRPTTRAPTCPSSENDRSSHCDMWEPEWEGLYGGERFRPRHVLAAPQSGNSGLAGRQRWCRFPRRVA